MKPVAPLLLLEELPEELLPEPVEVPLLPEGATGTEVPEAVERQELTAFDAVRLLEVLMVALPEKLQDVEALLVAS